MPRSGFALDGPTPDKPLWDRVKAWMNENAPGVVDAVSSAADTMLGPKNPPVNMALRGMGEVMRRGDPMNVMGGPTAMTLAHGTPAVWAAEAGAPLGQARRAFAKTGEGAAVKGEGFYAAQRGAVGENYRTALAERRATESAKIKGQPWDAGAAHHGDPVANVNDSIVLAMTGEKPMTVEQAIADTRSRLKPFRTDDPEWYRKANAHLDSLSPADIEVAPYNPGSLYALDYPDELLPRTLDFDAPVGRQSPEVLDALEKVGLFPPNTRKFMEIQRQLDEAIESPIPRGENAAEEIAKREARYAQLKAEADALAESLYSGGKINFDKNSAYTLLNERGPGRFTGEDIYRNMADDPEEASRLLAQAGIPGHKFRDGVSRGLDGDGTYNFVVYEPDKTLKTLGRYPNLEEFLKAHPGVPR